MLIILFFSNIIQINF